MATQPTQNPVPSELPRDLKFNAGKIDEFVTSRESSYLDRFGGRHYTVDGLNSFALESIKQFGYLTRDSFQLGATLTLPNEVLRDSDTGEYYRWDGVLPKIVPSNSKPSSSGGIGSGAWVSVGDASLRSNLFSPNDGLGDSLLRVRQPFPMATNRTQHDKNMETVSVDDFIGTTGDGIADDTQGFLNAVSQPNRKIILTPGKTYVLPVGVLVTQKNILISGYGARVKYGPTQNTAQHCFDIRGDNSRVEGVEIFCDSTLVRDKTGFAISFYNCNNVEAVDITCRDIASAGLWATNVNGLLWQNIKCFNNKADGMHVSNGVRNFRIADPYCVGCADDGVAVVNDTPGNGDSPFSGIISNGLVTDSLDGHGFVAIGCSSVIWIGCVARGCAGPGMGSYFWNAADPTKAESWVRNCLFIGNVIESCGLKPTNASNATSWFIGALRDCKTQANRVSGAPAAPSLGVPANCVQIANVYNLEMDSDYFYNSVKYGVMCLDTSVAGAATFTDLLIKSPTFRNITSDGIHLYPNATIGNIHVINPVFSGSPLDSSLNRSMYIGKTGNSKLVIAGAKNVGTNIPAAYDSATCYNVDIYDNKPEIVQTWTPVLSGQDGTPAGTVTATFNKKGDTIFFEATVRITSVNNAGNPIFTIPYPAKVGAIPNIIGRTESSGDNVGAGKMLIGLIQTDNNNVRILNYDNSRSLTNLVAPVVMRVSGYYRTP